MFEITIKIDTKSVEDAIRVCWSKEFMPPDNSYGRNAASGAGWKEVQRQVAAHIETLDLHDMIAKSAKAQIANVVDDIVSSALREKAKHLAKTMAKAGTLFEDKS